MSLQNLVGVSLDAIAPSRDTVTRLRSAAKRQIADAQVAGVSAETRFASAYTAIRMLADLALNAHGYRTLTSRPGHHQTSAAAECVAQAKALQTWVAGWLKTHKPELL